MPDNVLDRFGRIVPRAGANRGGNSPIPAPAAPPSGASGEFSSIPGYQASYNAYMHGQSLSPYRGDTNRANTHITADGAQFASIFKNLVGRDPTSDETNQFFTTVLGDAVDYSGEAGAQSMSDLANKSRSFVSDTFQGAAQDEALKKTQALQGQANTLADQFRTQGRAAISQTEQTLKDYADSVFKQIQPELITSLKTQGLLNTGALNEAEAGVQGDLAAQSRNFLGSASLANEQQANQIAFSGAAAPYNMKMANAQNQLPYLQGVGQQGIQNVMNTGSQIRGFQNQQALMQQQQQYNLDNQPSFLEQTGGMILGNFLGTGANTYGQKLASGGGGGGQVAGLQPQASEFAGMV